MKRSYLIGFAVALAALGLLAFAAWSFFEIYPVSSYLPPSREARINSYLALDRWLKGMGIPVRAESSGNVSMIRRADERTIFIQASLFRWTDEAVDYLADWVEGGGRLIVAYDYNGTERESLLLPEKFGITLEDSGRLPEDDGADGQWSIDSPNYDYNVSFEVSADSSVEEDPLCLKDWTGHTRLVEVKRGKGKLTVIGDPVFLSSWYIGDAPNARLAWALFAADNDGTGRDQGGCLFIRGASRVSGILGNLFSQGNLAVLLISLLVLLVIGFWTVIPVFGLVRTDEEKTGRFLRERFLAEGRFLKRYDALRFYCMVYLKEIRRMLAWSLPPPPEGKGQDGITGDDEFREKLLEILGNGSSKQDRELLVDFLGGEPVQYRKFPRMIKIFTGILERL